jgi:hypothetical protein
LLVIASQVLSAEIREFKELSEVLLIDPSYLYQVVDSLVKEVSVTSQILFKLCEELLIYFHQINYYKLRLLFVLVEDNHHYNRETP